MALIAALHRQLRIAAIDDGATIDDSAATRLWRRNSTEAPHNVLIEKLKKFTVKAPKSSPIIEECCCKRGMPQ